MNAKKKITKKRITTKCGFKSKLRTETSTKFETLGQIDQTHVQKDKI